jgi:hypothetical protein
MIRREKIAWEIIKEDDVAIKDMLETRHEELTRLIFKLMREEESDTTQRGRGNRFVMWRCGEFNF